MMCIREEHSIVHYLIQTELHKLSCRLNRRPPLEKEISVSSSKKQIFLRTQFNKRLNSLVGEVSLCLKCTS